jgi:aryl-alcohol dehydrogenase-like predicted oxidoreductase
MRYKIFGRSGLRVSELCLGTMTFGEDWGWGAGADESRAIFDAFAEAGGNFIDTAHIYTDGTSERLVGEFIASDRDHFVVATKYTPSKAGDIAKAGNSRKNMMRSVKESLDRLRTDHVDLYYVHMWDFTTPLDEVLRGLDDLVRRGIVLYAAISDTPAWQVSRANAIADLRGWTPFVGIQIEYSLVERTAERELLPMAQELDLGITAWAPLAGGVLTGKYAQDGTPRADQSVRKRPQEIPARALAIAAEVAAVASEMDTSPSRVALAWLRQRAKHGSVIPILGARNRAQIEDNLKSLEVTLTAEALERLDAASRIDLGFPHEMLATQAVRTLTSGGLADRLDNHRLAA